MNDILEIACFSPDALLIAQESGASRVEFCQNYELGGLTPDEEDILQARQVLTIPLHVMIRPRAGNFVYAKRELDMMQHGIRFCKNAGVDALVFGILTADGEVDEKACSQMLELAHPLPCCFHRAVDEAHDPDAAVKLIGKLGFRFLLSSGAAATALAGATTLARWQALYGSELQIIAAGALRASNIHDIRRNSSCAAFHSSAILNEASMLPDAGEINTMRQLLENPL